MPCEKPIQRGSWTFEVGQPLFLQTDDPQYSEHKRYNPELKVDDIHLRVDWQTLRRLPQSNAIVFNFKALFTPVNHFREEPYIPQLVAAATGVINAREYGRSIYDTWLRRQLIDIGEQIVSYAFGADPELDGPQQLASALQSDPATAPPKMTILLVDDDALIASSTAGMLEDLGHDVIEANSPARALEILRNGFPNPFSRCWADELLPSQGTVFKPANNTSNSDHQAVKF